MRRRWRSISWGVAAILAVCVSAPQPARATKIEIKYELTGTLVPALPQMWTLPVFGPSAPGPAGVGSTVTFRFEATPSGDPLASGDVSIVSFVRSMGNTIPDVMTGHFLLRLTGIPQSGPYGTPVPGGIVPITGGHLAGSQVSGTGSGLGFASGLQHCIAPPQFCSFYFGFPSYAQSYILPIGPRQGVPISFGTWICPS